MKKLLLSIAAVVFALNMNAQCNPYSPTVAGAKGYILPDSATGIAHACAGKPYTETINRKMLKDTTITGISAVVDSAVINMDPATIGLPSYLTVATVPATLPANSINNFPHITLRGDSMACIKLTGNVPASATAGVTPLTMNFKIRAKVLIFIDTTIAAANTNYKFVVDAPGTGACATAVVDAYKNINEIKAVPNPADNNLNIVVDAIKNENVVLEIANTFGQVLDRKNVRIVNGYNTINFNVANYAAGVYTYSISNGTNKLVTKWIKK